MPDRTCACFRACAIQPNGDVVPCGDYPDYVMGNIYEQTISEIWEGEKSQHWREYLIKYGNPGVLVKCSRLYDPVDGPLSLPRRIYRSVPGLSQMVGIFRHAIRSGGK